MTAIEHDIVQTLYYPAFRKEQHIKNLLERAGLVILVSYMNIPVLF
jgi:hypothetical protein